MKRRLASILAGGVIAAAALWFLVTPEVAAEMRLVAAAANSWMLAAAMLVTAAVQWLRAWRFSMLTDGTLDFPDARMVRIAFQLNFLNFTLPFRIGELGYPVLMQRAYGEPPMRSAGVLLLARVFDLCTVGAILAGSAAALGVAPALSSALWALALALTLAPFGLILGAHAALPLVRRLPLDRLAAAAAAEGGGQGRPRTAAPPAQSAAIVLSLGIWLIFGGMAALTAAAVGTAIGPVVALLGASAGNLAFALPINGIGGLGPSQAAFVAAVTRAGVAWNDAVIAALALYAVTLASALLFGGLAIIGSGRV